MKERNAATFSSFGDLFDFYSKEDPNRRALERATERATEGKKAASGCRSEKIAELVANDRSGFYDKYRAKLKMAKGAEAPVLALKPAEGKMPQGGLVDSYMGLFLPGSPKAVRIAASMKAFDDFEAGVKRRASRAKRRIAS